MHKTVIDLYVSLPAGHQDASHTVSNVIRSLGYFGFQSVDPLPNDSLQFSLLAHIHHEDEAPALSVPLLVDSSITHVHDLDGLLSALAGKIGHSCYFYESQTEWELAFDIEDEVGDAPEVPEVAAGLTDQVSSPDSVDANEDAADSHGTNAAFPSRTAYVIYGKVASPDRYVYELARDVKGPVALIPAAPTITASSATPSTAAPTSFPTICFPLEDPADTPVWLGKRPVVEIEVSDQTVVRWYSNGPKGSSLSTRLQNNYYPRGMWELATEPQAPLTYTPLQSHELVSSLARQDAQLLEILDAQASAVEDKRAEDALEIAEDSAALAQLGLELGLPEDKRVDLARVLTTTDRPVSLHELLLAMNLPDYLAQALHGEVGPQELEGALVAKSANFRAETGLHNLTERPTGNSFLDKMRLLDHDRPAFALGLIILMFLTSAGMFYLGIKQPSFFSNLVFTVSAYILGAIILLDAVVSLTSWIMIRAKNRTRK